MSDVAMIRQTLMHLRATGTVSELRILHTGRTGTVSGYYDDVDAMVQAASQWSGRAPGVYMTLNPCTPALLARSANRLTDRASKTTSDTDIVQRCWFGVDFDPVRPADISSTDAEHQAALQRARECYAWLKQRGWPTPLGADSGNGGHLLYRVDLPNDSASRDLLKRCLEALAIRFSDDMVVVDLSTFNAGRIWKVYGSMVCKGDNVPDRPHRLARLLNAPAALAVVSKAQLDALAALVPTPLQPSPRHGGSVAFDLERWIADHRLPVVSCGTWGNGGQRWVFKACPWNSEHTDRAAFVVQLPSGAIAAGCHHNSCMGNDWHALRDLYEPEWRTFQDHSQHHHVNGHHINRDATQHTPSRPGQGAAAAPRQLSVTRLSTVLPERVQWLWKPYLPLGRPVALEGDPGVGKSSLVAKIAAHLTSGTPFPNVLHGQAPQPLSACDVCLLTAEDDPGDTILPRVAVNGGDPSRVVLINGWHQPDGAQGLVTMQDLDLLKNALEQHTPRLLVFDPVQSFFGRGIDMNHASDTRPVLDAVVTLCKQHGCTPLFVRHIGKARRDKALYAGLGSIDITAAMRSVLFLGQDPEMGSRRIFAQSKANNAQLGPSLAYRIVSVDHDMLTTAGDLVTVEAPRLDWDGLSMLTANDLASPPPSDEEEKSALDQAREFLRELLADGPVLADEVHVAAKQAGIASRTLRRAKPLEEVQTRRRRLEDTPSKDWPWEWVLPDGHRDDTPSIYAAGHLGHLENVPTNSNTYDDTSRWPDGHLEPEQQHKENQSLALDGLDGQSQYIGSIPPCVVRIDGKLIDDDVRADCEFDAFLNASEGA